MSHLASLLMGITCFTRIPLTLVQWKSTQSISSSGIRGYRSGSYQWDPVLYYLLAGEEWERCWRFLIWLYLEDNVNENWVLLLVQSKCRGRPRHLRKSGEAIFQGKPFNFINIRAITYHMPFVLFYFGHKKSNNKIIEGTQWPNIRVNLYMSKIQDGNASDLICLVSWYLSFSKYKSPTITHPNIF